VAVSCDIGVEDSREAAFKILDNHGFTPDILVNSAGISIDSLLVRASTSDVAALINTNLVGTMLFTKGIVRSMLRARRGGCIVTVGSVIGTHGGAGQTAYAASKVRHHHMPYNPHTPPPLPSPPSPTCHRPT
jgi:3-oxoacyl-[acyl-carrier protein] reductase